MAELEPTTAEERKAWERQIAHADAVFGERLEGSMDSVVLRLIKDVERHQAVTQHDLACKRCMDGLYCEERTKLCRIAMGLPPLEDALKPPEIAGK
jgi:hypothetical protein